MANPDQLSEGYRIAGAPSEENCRRPKRSEKVEITPNGCVPTACS
jgi:hypothetical protein